ncbi:MAG: hypothetical protein M3680_02635 [Myxococcota bacterium]|nr:hypothetical protein [Myxococcota bacterium]
MTKSLHSLGLALTLAFFTMGLTGCQLYFGGDSDIGDRPGGGGGWSCESNLDCAAGCYCEGATPSKSGICEEAGFCSQDSDCPTGYTCDDRSSCVPDQTPTCEQDVDCAAGSFCTGGVCETSCICSNDAEAQEQGWQHCDETRNTCKPQNDGGTCGGTPTCGTQPACPVGSVALTGADGCYLGTCSAVTTCDVTPTCAAYQHEADCFGAGGCSASYTGINCRKPDGSACQAGDTGCTCESFVFATCN